MERNRIMITTELTGVVAEHVAAVNALDTDAIVATFAEDAYVNDARREFVGIEAIRRWVAKEMVGDQLGTDGVSPVAAPARLANRAGLAPAYIDVGDLDIFRDEAIAYAQNLARAGIPIELHVHPGVPHGWERFAPNSSSARRAMADRAHAIAAL
jgi:acetyl esterase/lipase